MKKFARTVMFPLFTIILVVSVPVFLALYLSYQQALSAEIKAAMSYATGVQYRSDQAADQIDQAIRLMVTAQSPDPCSDSNIIIMRRIDLTSSYLQTVGHVAGDSFMCSSYGRNDPVPMGPADVEHTNGVKMRAHVTFPFAIGNTFMVIERDGYAAVVHTDHATDITTGVINISLALYSTETGMLLGSRGDIRPEWLTILGDQSSATTVRDDHIIAALRSERYRTASVAAIPVIHLHEVMYNNMVILLPIGFIAGLILVFMLLRLLQQRSVLQASDFNLRERIKELTLMHGTARLLMDKRLANRELFSEVVKLIPSAMQYPDLCQARIRHDGIEAATPGWRESPYLLTGNIATDDGERGKIEIIYTQQPPGTGMQTFQPEEHTLVDSVTEMLNSWLNRRRAEERVNLLAYFERVTGLPNRVTLENRIKEAIEAAGISGDTVALLLLNLTGFRDIVSTLGHHNGDVLLRHVAETLRGRLEKDDLLASMGGNQFVVLLSHLRDRGQVDKFLAGIMNTLDRPVQIAGIPIKLEVSIGIALYPEHGDSMELLMQRSEIALRAARNSNRNHLHYSTAIDDYQPERIALVGELPEAIDRDQLVLHYQPKIDLKTGKTMGVEALVRWQHPERGLIFPDKFIPLAEKTQIINALTRWVLVASLRQCRIWHDAGFDLKVSINLSTRNLLDTELCESIPDMAQAAGVPLDRLILEITESGIMADPEQCKRLLNGLHERGVMFSMDDFGIGQSSLSYIKDLPIYRLKIDKSFVIGFREPRNAAIVHAAIDMGHSLEMQVTAEGVEDEQTLKVLKAFGCDIGQGYFFSKPLPVDKLTSWLMESTWGCKPEDTGKS